MKKRKLNIKELFLVFLESDITKDGRLKKHYKAHISRRVATGKKSYVLACKREPDLRWVYPYYPESEISPSICGTCLTKIMNDLEGYEWSETLGRFTPTSNRGVN